MDYKMYQQLQQPWNETFQLFKVSSHYSKVAD